MVRNLIGKDCNLVSGPINHNQFIIVQHRAWYKCKQLQRFVIPTITPLKLEVGFQVQVFTIFCGNTQYTYIMNAILDLIMGKQKSSTMRYHFS